MTDYGITSEGFVGKPLSVIDAEIDALLKSTFGNQINTTPQSVFGQLKGLYAERESLIWELIEDTYDSQYRSSASGTSLDLVNSLIAVDRLGALDSRVNGQVLLGSIGTLIPTGTLFSVSGNSSIVFRTISDVTLIAGTDEVQDITFDAPPTSGSFKITYKLETSAAISFAQAAVDVQTALNALDGLAGITVAGSYAAGFTVTFAGTDGKQIQPILGITDNTLLDTAAPVIIVVTETTPGVDQGTVDCISETSGAVSVNINTLTVIDTPISGLTSTHNLTAAIVGRDIETDTEYRIRSENELQISRAGTAAAISAAILDLNDDTTAIAILSAVVFENDTGAVVAGRPAKSFEAVVYQDGGGITRDQDIADAIMSAKPAGIESHGDISKSVVDSQGFTKTMEFSRPDEITIYLILDLTVTAAYPTDGDTQVQTIMKAFGDDLGTGQDVIVYPALVAELNVVAGITDVVVKIGIAPAPTLANNIPIDDGTGGDIEISVWETVNITVNS